MWFSDIYGVRAASESGRDETPGRILYKLDAGLVKMRGNGVIEFPTFVYAPRPSESSSRELAVDLTDSVVALSLLQECIFDKYEDIPEVEYLFARFAIRC